MASFTITAKPGTDIWRKPPSTNIFNAPSKPPTTGPSTAPLSAFVSARVSFRLPAAVQYDQAGLLLSLRPPSSPSSSAPPPKWIKTGVEFYNGTPMVGTVACDAYADWSLAPVAGSGEEWVTVAVERGQDENGVGVWVYQVLGSGEKVPLREVCWIFGKETEGWEVEVGAFAARPNTSVTEALEPEFKGLEVEWAA
ncbi:hypothetical protein NKR23_g12156 [Pleurostoma richardsiae]|uniref:Uncharacterized protein n=1 Tax=Pleurostoma richardsiae TaxID=41990 RepID=A0AA38RFA7_9PEZI|nr:hypothetical protein NKR23_g12156 [Pleurostoma richardsiae]